VVLNLIRKYEPISRREIADRTGLSFQTVANITQNLFDLLFKELLHEELRKLAGKIPVYPETEKATVLYDKLSEQQKADLQKRAAEKLAGDPIMT
jgi:transcriptional regulator with XRE-family HTH domain